MGPFLGVVHLLPCPSVAGQAGSFDALLTHALRDAEALAGGGVDGIVVENFGDAPFHKGTRAEPTSPDVVATLAVVAREVRAATGLPVGINCLRNDACAALAAAAVAGAKWVRVNVLAGAMVTDQGVIEGEAARVAAYRRALAADVQILADLRVKHATPLAPGDPLDEARDLLGRAGADGLIVTGKRTGEPVDADFLRQVKAAAGGAPVWIGSGLDVDNAPMLWPLCDGAVVGTSLKRGGRIDGQRVRALRAVLTRQPAG